MPQKYKVILSVFGLSLISMFWIFWSSFNPVNEKALVKFISVKEILDLNNTERVRLGGIVLNLIGWKFFLALKKVYPYYQ